VKGLLGRPIVRSREAFIEEIGRASDAVNTKDTRGFFEHCGYPLAVRPLRQPLWRISATSLLPLRDNPMSENPPYPTDCSRILKLCKQMLRKWLTI
jgi:hypothetical protein